MSNHLPLTRESSGSTSFTARLTALAREAFSRQSSSVREEGAGWSEKVP